MDDEAAINRLPQDARVCCGSERAGSTTEAIAMELALEPGAVGPLLAIADAESWR